MDHFSGAAPVTPNLIPELLLSGAIDCALCARRGEPHDRLDYSTLYRESMVVAFPDGHAFEDTKTVPLKRIVGEQYLDRLHCEFRDTFNAQCAEQDVMLDVAFTSQREDWIQNMIREGAGVGVLPEFSLLHPVLKHRPIDAPKMYRDVELATVFGGPKTTGLRALIDAAQHYPWVEQIGPR